MVYGGAEIEDLKGGDKEENAGITTAILRGEQGSKRNIVLMNSALAFIVAGKTGEYSTALEIAADSIDSGKAREKLEEVKRVSNAL